MVRWIPSRRLPSPMRHGVLDMLNKVKVKVTRSILLEVYTKLTYIIELIACCKMLLHAQKVFCERNTNNDQRLRTIFW